jgi:hypothetical protein
MYGIQQEELFSFEQLMEMADELKFSVILEHLPIESILHAVNKKGVRGRPESLNTRAMVYSSYYWNGPAYPFYKGLSSSSKNKCCV